MSKNIFEALNKVTPEDPEIVPERKLSKKEQRAQDKILRNAYAVETGKESTQNGLNPKHVKELSQKEGERVYDRHSGTGKQAFGNVQKKGGHGKGNYGKVNLKDFEGVQNSPPPKENYFLMVTAFAHLQCLESS